MHRSKIDKCSAFERQKADADNQQPRVSIREKSNKKIHTKFSEYWKVPKNSTTNTVHQRRKRVYFADCHRNIVICRLNAI